MLSGLVLFTTTARGQTLFARTDTTPAYASYRHLEECVVTVLRVGETREPIWWDTAGAAQRKAAGVKREVEVQIGMRRALPTAARSDAAIQAGRVCLARFNADTATFKSAEYGQEIFETLLMVNRDDDARRFVERFLDSMRARSATDYKDQLQSALEKYTRARPLRYAEAKQMHARIMTTVAGDSGYRAVRADKELSMAAERLGDTIYANELGWHAIRANDAIPEEERKRSPEAQDWMPWLTDRLAHFTENEGFDSLATSTLAYNMYKANTVNRRVYGGDLATATDARVQPIKVPDLVGEHYYASTTGASYTKHGALSPGTLPVKGRINFITSWPSFCHTEGGMRPPELAKQLQIYGSSCAKEYNKMRRFKAMYPDLEIIVLSDTYGTVGKLGPLELADEADTLAKLFLGHHRVPAHLVVEHTPFFHVEAPDGRRIDLPTPQMELMGRPRTMWNDQGGIRWLLDKEGYMVGWGVDGEGAGSGDYWDRFITILKNRPSKP